MAVSGRATLELELLRGPALGIGDRVEFAGSGVVRSITADLVDVTALGDSDPRSVLGAVSISVEGTAALDRENPSDAA